MVILLTIVHVLVAIFLICVVLLQTGKRADLAGAFGGGGSQTAFGPRGAANVLSRLTTWSAGIFMFTSLALSLMAGSSSGRGSVLDSVPAPAPASAPATPAPSAPAPSTPAPGSSAPAQQPSPAQAPPPSAPAPSH
jgi:preprotein translocase subunit SecG